MTTYLDAYERTETCNVCKNDIMVLFYATRDGDDEDLDVQPEGRVCGECKQWCHHGCADADMCYTCARGFQEFSAPISRPSKPAPRRKGVWYSEFDKLWHAMFIEKSGKRNYLGSFVLEDLARKAYERKARVPA